MKIKTHLHSRIASRRTSCPRPPWWVMVVLLFTFIVLLPGCPSPDGGYRTINVDKGIAKFSFEYPSSYGVASLDIREGEYNYTRVGLRGPGDSPALSLLVTSESPGELPAAGELDRELAWSSQHLPGFRLLSRSKLEVAGLTGEQVAYYYDGQSPPPYVRPEPWPVIPIIAREAILDGPTKQWSIYLGSVADKFDSIAGDWEHVLSTLKILG